MFGHMKCSNIIIEIFLALHLILMVVDFIIDKKFSGMKQLCGKCGGSGVLVT
jgi:hypothetical protein